MLRLEIFRTGSLQISDLVCLVEIIVKYHYLHGNLLCFANITYVNIDLAVYYSHFVIAVVVGSVSTSLLKTSVLLIFWIVSFPLRYVLEFQLPVNCHG